MKFISKSGLTGLILSILLVSCQTAENDPNQAPLSPLALPQLSAVSLNNQPLKVVATTNMIGDIAGRIGGEAVDLTILIAPGQDSHSYEPSSGDLTAAADAHVIFVNGWNLEEGLIANLENVSEDGVVVPVSAGIAPLPFAEHGPDEHAGGEEEEHAGADPHTWLDPHLVVQWVENISQVLGTLDPANAPLYRQNAADYLIELHSLIQYYDEQVATIPTTERVIVTNHDAFGYFAAAYNFEIIGTVLAGSSTLAEPSAEALAELVETMKEAGVCTVFIETSASPVLAETVAAELDSCDNVQIVTLYTGSIGPPGSGADSYIGMMTANIDAIISGFN